MKRIGQRNQAKTHTDGNKLIIALFPFSPAYADWQDAEAVGYTANFAVGKNLSLWIGDYGGIEPC